MPPVKVEVPLPCTTRKPVVVAPPETVRPLACAPPPMVELADEIRPASVDRPETPSVELIVCTPVNASVVPSNVRLEDDVRESVSLKYARRLVAPVPSSPPSPAAERQEPDIEKHPPARSMPRAKVLGSDVPVMLR